MARIRGVEPKEAGPVIRFAYWLTRRKLGRLIMPLKITAHHPRIFRAYMQMEVGQQAARSVDRALKALVQVKVASLIGCPF